MIEMISLEQSARRSIEKLLMGKGKDVQIILYPFGKGGEIAKGILNHEYDIQEVAIIDNYLSKQSTKIHDFSILNEYPNAIVLITSYRLDLYDAIRQPLFQLVPEEKCVEAFIDNIQQEKESPKKRIEEQKVAKERACKAVKKILASPSWKQDMTYHPQNTQSMFYLPYAAIDCIQQEILLADDYYERKTLDYCFTIFHGGIIGKKVEGKTIVDIGANIGNHSLFFANETGANKVISFEPIDEAFEILYKNVLLNKLNEKVIIHHCGLGEKESHAVMDGYNYNNLGATPIDVSEDGDIIVKTLDGFQISDDIRFMKIDVEGMELSVLKGGIETIKKNHPFIMLEAFDLEECMEENRKVQDFLENIGYLWERIDVANLLFFDERDCC